MIPFPRAVDDLFSTASRPTRHALARWLFLRALGLIYLSAFFALIFQVRGLIGTHGILPADQYLQSLTPLGPLRLWAAPTLLWLAPTDAMLVALCWIGLLASLLVLANLAPRLGLLVCFACFLSFVAAAQDFSGYQSDSMLLEAGFLALFLAPSGLRPRLTTTATSVHRLAHLLLLWEWLRIYFESGIVKLTSGDPTWHNLTAMFDYYQNGPLPTWIGWYLQHLPPWFHIATAGLTLVMELVLIWMALLPRRWRLACFLLVTLWQLGVIASANYAFLNYLVLILALLLLDDGYLRRVLPALRQRPTSASTLTSSILATLMLGWIAYATTFQLLPMLWPAIPASIPPIAILEPFRIANRYGLFAVMTPHRYEIEFQGSNDGVHWTPYPFRYKPQDPAARPRIYAPYQPRFDWNLWFASLGPWQQSAIVPRTQQLLLQQDADVLHLFASNPFPTAPPLFVRTVLWQYWFSTPQQHRDQHLWWRRTLLGTFSPTLARMPQGGYTAIDEPTASPRP